MSKFEAIKLQGTTWTLHLPITQEMLGDVNAELYVDHALQTATIHLRGSLYYENLEVIEHPADWWQAFKARWFPNWVQSRWPVQMRRWEINAYYPTIKWEGMPSTIRVPRLKEEW